MELYRHVSRGCTVVNDKLSFMDLSRSLSSAAYVKIIVPFALLYPKFIVFSRCSEMSRTFARNYDTTRRNFLCAITGKSAYFSPKGTVGGKDDARTLVPTFGSTVTVVSQPENAGQLYR